MKLAIIGSRSFSDKSLLFDKVYDLGKMYFITEIISGGAEGADSLAKEFAEGMMVPFKEIRPDYEAYASNPRIAPLARNKCMVAEADIVVAFWDGKSRGTKFTIDAALDAKKPVFIIPF